MGEHDQVRGRPPHHPWRAFRALSEWTLRWVDHLPARQLGETSWPDRTVSMAHGQDQAQRRCTIAHETEHILRGSVHEACTDHEERAVEEAVARKLITLEALADALVWCISDDLRELADELWVDMDIVRARLRALTLEEGHELDRRLDHAERQHPAAEHPNRGDYYGNLA